jgi:hypothetical protein
MATWKVAGLGLAAIVAACGCGGASSGDGPALDDAGAADVAAADVAAADAAAADAAADVPTPPQHAVRPCSGLPDGGPSTWEKITPMSGAIWPMSSTIDPTGALWVGGYGRSMDHPGNGGLFKSTDCGATWSKANDGMNAGEIDRSDIWSIAVDLDSAAEPTVYVIGMYGPFGLWKSTNGGRDFTQLLPAGDMIAHVVPAGPGVPPIAAIASISMDPTNHQHLVAGVHATCVDPYGPICDLLSNDGGASWSIVRVPVIGATAWEEQTGPFVLGDKTWIHASMGHGIWLTTDDGKSWNDVTPAGASGATGGEYTMHPFVPTSLGSYFLPSALNGGPGGLLRSSGIGQPWSTVNGAPPGNYNIAFAAGGGMLFIGDGYGATLNVALETDPSHWKSLPLPPITDSGWGVWYLDYDATNGLLYALIDKPWKWSDLYRIAIRGL